MKELVTRTLSGVIFTAAVLASLIVDASNPFPFIILFSFFVARTDYEYLRLTMGKGQTALKILSITAALCVFLLPGIFLHHFGCSVDTCTPTPYSVFCLILLAVLVAVFLAVPVFYLFSGGTSGFEFVWSSLFYIAIPFSALTVVSFCPDGYDGWRMASLLIVMWMGDVGAYCIGTAFGQGAKGHKLMPSVSPKKSWEGVYGAVAFSIITALVLRAFNLLLPGYDYFISALFALVVCVSCIIGDLVESKIKRRYNVKDSGKIMPGHGGFLDRFDSGLVAFPVALLFYMILCIL